jgi:hypothetical protein
MNRKLTIDMAYPYVYETHLHTSQGSACGLNTGSDMAKACKEAGYDGIIVTDHFFYGNTAVDRSLPWSVWVEEFCKGYEDAKKEGDRIGLKVFFGWEACYKAVDFLVYGLDKAWLLDHPEIRDASISEQYQLVKASGGMVIHAHPYREEVYIPCVRLYPEYVDGVETVNAAHYIKYRRNDQIPDWDEKALKYAQKHDFRMTAGSDIHSTNLILGGMAFKEELHTIQDYIKAVMERKECRLLGKIVS